jgi:hypothetical protein
MVTLLPHVSKMSICPRVSTNNPSSISGLRDLTHTPKALIIRNRWKPIVAYPGRIHVMREGSLGSISKPLPCLGIDVAEPLGGSHYEHQDRC